MNVAQHVICEMSKMKQKIASSGMMSASLLVGAVSVGEGCIDKLVCIL
jgi:hypothetical protein